MIKMTMEFTCDAYDWTETWYTNASYPVAPFNNLKAVGQDRAQLLGAGASLTAVRLIDTAKPRNSYYVPLAGWTTESTVYTTAAGYFSDRPYSAIVVKFIDGAGYTKLSYFSGVPDLLIGEKPTAARGVEQDLVVGWVNLLAQLTFDLNAGGWGWLRQVWTGTPGGTQILGVATAAGGEVSISTQTQLAFAGPQQVVIRGYRRVATRAPGVNGVWKIDPQSPGAQSGAAAPFIYWLLGTPLSAGQAANHTGIGYVTPVAKTVSVVQNGLGVQNSYNTIGATHRKRGASLNAPRGRSRTRA